ncbi:4Fe-4S ferredoxin iron-sulfur binding domain-containing protein [Methanobacterium lacus]|uniref:4Fe-4S ferredoxin iron-sulfur binding domain-containing protein n=1 Tax=Methanobacterium lacus (strain AL-21) TaxID=877455 RepID=F0TB54_METLA|nr:4Fe-4S binding protein [Methanobacterium lacus]ADZ10200.1 4Fe-4S ferredoxin iron-sulfur binding domain-containing protein [Methanobacterium lacus]
MKRDVIRINEDKCTGCGDCIPGCPEGALQVVDGKARLISDLFCDGLGACIGTCPQGAIEIEQREAEEYDERKVMENIIKGGKNVIKAHLQHLNDHGQKKYLNQAIHLLEEKNIPVPNYEHEKTFACECPGAREMELEPSSEPSTEAVPDSKPELKNWPIQLQLLNPNAPYLKNADLLIAADCAPFAYPNFNQKFLKGKILIILCPKLDKTIEEYIDKLAEIFKIQDIHSISIVHMEVPCCSGIGVIVNRALEKAKKDITVEDYTISINGEVINTQ